MLRIVHHADTDGQPIPPLDFDELCRLAAREMLALALEAERRAHLEGHAALLDADGHRLVVGNGYAQRREVMTGAGMAEVTAPRVHDRRPDECFGSALLPPYLRRSPKVTEVLPLLYLRGLSSGDFAPAMASFFGSDAGLSASTITRLTEAWQAEHAGWSERDLSTLDYVYWWVDLHFRIRLEEDRLCCLVIVGVRPDGSKQLVALTDGYRESSESWAELLRDLKDRGLIAPVLAVGDGALGFWAALRDGLPRDARAEVLGAQERQCAQCAAQADAARGQGRADRDLQRRDARRGARGGAGLRRDVQRLAQGGVQGDRRARHPARLLRLSGKERRCRSTQIPPTGTPPESRPIHSI